MYSIATGMMPAPMIAATQAPASSTRVEAEQRRPRAFGRAQDAHGGLRDDAELAFRAGDQAEQVVARAVEMVAADLDHGAVDQHQRDAQQVVGGHAVFQAMGAAGIHGDVAGDRAGELARRVGRVEEALVGDRLADAEIGDAGCDAGGAVRRNRRRAPGSSWRRRARWRPPAGWRRRQARCRRPRGTTLTPCSWQKRMIAETSSVVEGSTTASGMLAIGGQPVRLEGAALVLRDDEGLGCDEPGQPRDDLRAARQDRLVRLRKCNRHGALPAGGDRSVSPPALYQKVAALGEFFQ